MKKLIFAILFFVSSFSHAQLMETLSSDRPAQALSANTVGENVFQIQAGIDFFNSNSNFYPNSFFRYGISERFEIHSGFILSGENFGNELDSFVAGGRYRFSDKENKFQKTLFFSYDFAGLNSSQFTYILGSSLSNKISYTINLGVNLDQNLSLNNRIYVFNLAYNINDKLGVAAEAFGTVSDNRLQVNFDVGLFYNLNNNLVLDFTIGENEGLFLGTGFTWRVLPKEKRF